MTMIKYEKVVEVPAQKPSDNRKNDYALHVKTHTDEQLKNAEKLAGGLTLA
jgi:hypothetical protein